MPLSARAWTLPDEALATSTHRGLNLLVEQARTAGLPLLGGVDPYDDTRFNRLQAGRLVPELECLLDADDAQVAGAAEELLALTRLVTAKPHRYLLLVGD